MTTPPPPDDDARIPPDDAVTSPPLPAGGSAFGGPDVPVTAFPVADGSPAEGGTVPTPPPGCPAHGLGLGPGGLVRLFGAPHDDNPYALYEELREEHGAVAPVLLPGDLRAHLVLGHREILEVARTESSFSRDPRNWWAMKEGKVPAGHPLAPVTRWQPLCAFTDGEEHERLRRAVSESLGRFEGRGLRQHVTRFAHQLIDGFAGRGRVDLVGEFAEQLPMMVMTRLFGMSESYGDNLVKAATDMISGSETAAASNAVIEEALQTLVDRARVNPKHDLASVLLSHSAQLTDDEVREHLRLMMVAGHEPTAHLLSNTLEVILTDKRFRGTLAGGQMTLPDALDQVLWDEPPMTTNIGRWTTGETTIAGKVIPDGEMLLLGLAGGNADPAIRPDKSAPMYGNRSHLAFSGGPHECPGQDLGRAIVETGIDTLLERIPDLRLAKPDLERKRKATPMQFGLVELCCEFAPQRLPGSPERDQEPRAELPPQQVPSPVSEPLPEAVVPVVSARAPWWRRWLGLGGRGGSGR